MADADLSGSFAPRAVAPHKNALVGLFWFCCRCIARETGKDRDGRWGHFATSTNTMIMSVLDNNSVSFVAIAATAPFRRKQQGLAERRPGEKGGVRGREHHQNRYQSPRCPSETRLSNYPVDHDVWSFSFTRVFLFEPLLLLPRNLCFSLRSAFWLSCG